MNDIQICTLLRDVAGELEDLATSECDESTRVDYHNAWQHVLSAMKIVEELA